MSLRHRLLAALAIFPAALAAQQKPTVPVADYGKFETLGATSLSPDGKWVVAGVSRVDTRAELRLRKVGSDSTKVIANASGAQFSADSRWLLWTVGVSPDERRKLEREKKPIPAAVALLELATGKERKLDGVTRAAFDPSGRWVVAQGTAPAEPKGRGGDARLIDLRGDAADLTLGPVGEYAWNTKGGMLAFTVATGGTGINTAQLLHAATGRLIALDGSTSAYRSLVWRKDADDLALYRSTAAASVPGSRAELVVWRGLAGAAPVKRTLATGGARMADSLELVSFRRPVWSDDGRALVVGLRRQAAKDSAKGDSASRAPAVEKPGVQIWHTKDVALYPAQKLRAAGDTLRTLATLWWPDSGAVRTVGTDARVEPEFLKGWRLAVERPADRYDWGTMFGRRYHDVRVIDVATGTARLAVEKVRTSSSSTGGRYLLWWDGTDWLAHDLQRGTTANLTKGLATTFADTLSDTPSDQKPAYPVAGWLDGDAGVLLQDRYDVWLANPDGSGARRITRGAEDSVTHRVARIGVPFGEPFDRKKPLWFTLHNEWNQKRGYARMLPGKGVERVTLEDRSVAGLVRADSAEVYLYRVGTRSASPMAMVGSAALVDAKPVVATNPFLGDYAWTKAELVSYRSETGRDLRGILLYPANHDPSKKYPMIVYAYEKLSQGLYDFQVPNEANYYNFTAWTQQGYFVLMPDVVFRARDPGVSFLETLRPAIAGVAARGLVDPAKVGFIGHSWGGYEAAYVAAWGGKLFAASVAGAPLTDFISFMGQIHWASGSAELDHWETGQARMEVPYWEDKAAHERNSPIHNVHNMTTPLLMAFGDNDGTVDWDQGTEFYNFARRAGKQMVLLVYEGEDHGFSKRPNQIDYHRRILEWFGHYLKGEPAAKWITDGVPFAGQDAEQKRLARPGT